MLDYTRWVYSLDFCTPRYMILKELKLEKLKIDWGLRAMRYEKRSKEFKGKNLVKLCWLEKDKSKGKGDLYRMERERFYNDNGWSTRVIKKLNGEGRNMEGQVRIREQDIQGQIINSKIAEARYNKRYREIGMINETPNYLLKGNLEEVRAGDEIRAMVKLRCGNLEEANKYWISEEEVRCKFCEVGKDNLEHLVVECNVASIWFEKLGKNKEDRLRNICDDMYKSEIGKVLNKLWREREECKKN